MEIKSRPSISDTLVILYIDNIIIIISGINPEDAILKLVKLLTALSGEQTC
jgi:hypothetical protein